MISDIKLKDNALVQILVKLLANGFILQRNQLFNWVCLIYPVNRW